jgi:hypothetical protein
MRSNNKMPDASAVLLSAISRLLCGTLLLIGVTAGFGQVNPAEILNPQLRAAESTYLQQLKALNRDIRATKFPFPFFLSRYVGLDPRQQVEADTRGVEFAQFHDRVVLKITGNYNAAYNADLLTQNQRAGRVFQEVVIPLLQLVVREIPHDVTCDAIGFEISYHVRRRTRNRDYEGKEILVLVLDKTDAFGYFNAGSEAEHQDILNRSEIYVNGKEFGLALGEREPLSLEALARAVPHQPAPTPSAAAPGSGTRLSRLNQELPPGAGLGPPRSYPPSGTDKLETEAAPVAAATPADTQRLQTKYQSQLDALVKEGVAKFQFVDYAPPSFVIFRNQVVLQFTLRNPLHFEKETSSIYKRAAQSFDLFLAPQLKALLEKTPADADIQGLDITLLNQLAAKPNPSSEALEFIFPLKPLRQFVDAEITNQELINQSTVLVNGVRIALNLQQVE